MARRGYPPEFRRKVLDLLASGRKVADVARDLEISDQTIYAWRRQDRIDRGVQPGLTTGERTELAAANRKIAALEAELAAAKRALEILEPVVPPKGRYAAIRVMAADGHSVQLTCRLVGVAESGYYEWRDRPLSARALRHAHLSETIRAIHADSRGTYGSRRVRAELVLGHGVQVGHGQVELLMRRAGLHGLPGRKRWRHVKPETFAADLVKRDFARSRANALWVTDITEHPTREGKVYCAVVLDTFSRRVVGWSIDASPTAALVTNALSMAIGNRAEVAGTVIHSDQGVQFGSWAFTQRAKDSGLVPSMGSIGDCYDNGLMESFWARMQVELLNRAKWRTRLELANAIFDYLEIFHNRQRRHSALGYLTPIQFENQTPVA
jgi:transposase InsO family protein